MPAFSRWLLLGIGLAALAAVFDLDRGLPALPPRDLTASLTSILSATAACAHEPPRLERLTSAVLAVEAASRSAGDRALEQAVILPAARAGLAVGDFSVGLAQIRPSTALRFGGADVPRSTAAAYIALIEQPCFARAVAGSYLHQLMESCAGGEVGDVISRCEVDAVRRYNGQVSVSAQNVIYVEAVAMLFAAQQ